MSPAQSAVVNGGLRSANFIGNEMRLDPGVGTCGELIERCGYWRRKEELEDAEAAAKNWK